MTDSADPTDQAGSLPPEDAVSGGQLTPRTSGTASALARARRSWVILGIGLLIFAVGLLGWWQASGDDAVAQAQQRDTVLVSARHDIEVMNTLDHDKIEEGLAAWAAVSTGKLKDSLADVTSEQKNMLAEQKKVSVGKVLDAAVVELNADSAVVIAAIEVTVKDDAKPDAEPVVKRNRFSATMAKVGDKWLIEDLQQVAVNLS